MKTTKSEKTRKWIQTLGICALGVGLIWANVTAGNTATIRQDSIDACERNVADRKTQQSGHRRVAQAMRVVAASSQDATLIKEFNAAADRMTALAFELDPLIEIDCKEEMNS